MIRRNKGVVAPTWYLQRAVVGVHVYTFALSAILARTLACINSLFSNFL
jgi:hypothetical protein